MGIVQGVHVGNLLGKQSSMTCRHVSLQMVFADGVYLKVN